jgi:SagB-type dehydrogenase family enzyme
VELALIVWRATDLEPAAYRYQPLGHRLLRSGEFAEADAARLAGPTPDGAAGLVVLWCDLTGPAFVKYGAKGYRLMLLEAGHIMQNLVLVAQAMGLPALPIAGFCDAEVAAVLGLDMPEQVPVYGLLLGASP